jgi:hypothetical protein
MQRRSVALIGALTLMVAGTTTAFAGGMITAKETGSFVIGDEVGYPDGHTFDMAAGPGTTIDSGIARLPAGASFGWHYHTAPVLVTVTQGSLTLYAQDCSRQVVSAGGGFVEEPNTVHLARNEGSSLVVIAWTYVGVQPGQPEDVYKPADYDPCGGIH